MRLAHLERSTVREASVSRREVPKKRTALVRVEHITRTIVLLRGQRVILDAELATLYGVTTKALNRAVKRNVERFPGDFRFRLDCTEVQALNRSQSVTGSQKHRDPRFPPFAFTEQSWPPRS